MKKKKIIIVSIVTISIFLFVLYFLFNHNELSFNLQMKGVNKDIIIQKCEVHTEIGGYATTSHYYYIDLNTNMIYDVTDYYVYGGNKKDRTYTLNATKELTDDEINTIIDLTKLDSDYNIKHYETEYSQEIETSQLDPLYFKNFYTITYKGKTIELNDSTVWKLIKIIDSIK